MTYKPVMKVCKSMMSSVHGELINTSPVSALAVSAQGVEMTLKNTWDCVPTNSYQKCFIRQIPIRSGIH